MGPLLEAGRAPKKRAKLGSLPRGRQGSPKGSAGDPRTTPSGPKKHPKRSQKEAKLEAKMETAEGGTPPVGLNAEKWRPKRHPKSSQKRAQRRVDFRQKFDDGGFSPHLSV